MKITDLTVKQHVIYQGQPAIVQKVNTAKAIITTWQMTSPMAPEHELREFDISVAPHNLKPGTWQGPIQFLKLHVIKGVSPDGPVWTDMRYIGRVEEAYATVIAENTITGELTHIGDTEQRIRWLPLKIVAAAHAIANTNTFAARGWIVAAIEWHDEPPEWLM
jgi:hypothetical protein